MNCSCEDARGTCPLSIPCPSCPAGPGQQCLRPSGHGCSMHTERYRTSEILDGDACPGLLRYRDGCGLCSGLPGDHPRQEAVIDGLTKDDYHPGHPWYYFLGGMPPTAAEIHAAGGITPPDDFGKYDRRARIEDAIGVADAALKSDLARYEDIVARGDDALSEWDRHYDAPGECLGLHVALALAHNHVCYRKGLLGTLRALLAAEPKGPSTALTAEIRNLHVLGLFSPGQLARKFNLDLATIRRLLK